MSLADDAAKRHALRVAEIEKHLANGLAVRALWVALKGVMSETKKLFMLRTADGMLTMADYAGTLTGDSLGFWNHRPARPTGCPAIPRPQDLLLVFRDSLRRSTPEEGS
jgi:hypothetical protein